jgi:hypothetical protein
MCPTHNTTNMQLPFLNTKPLNCLRSIHPLSYFIHLQIKFRNSEYNVWRIVTIAIELCKPQRTL